MFSVLPFIFIPHYSSLFLYIPLVGWVIYAASFIVESRDYCLAKFQASGMVKETIGHSGKAQILTFLLFAVLLIPAHLAEIPRTLENFMGVPRPPMSQFARQLGQLHSEVPAETRILFVNDPFEADNYVLMELVQIYYRDPSIVVERQKGLPKASSLNFADYDYVFDYSDGKLIERH